MDEFGGGKADASTELISSLNCVVAGSGGAKNTGRLLPEHPTFPKADRCGLRRLVRSPAGQDIDDAEQPEQTVEPVFASLIRAEAIIYTLFQRCVGDPVELADHRSQAGGNVLSI